MKKGTFGYFGFQIVLENIGLLFSQPHWPTDRIHNNNAMLDKPISDNFTTFQQKLWKTPKSLVRSNIYALLLCILVLSSCTMFKSTKEAKPSHPALQNNIISMTEDEVRKNVGEPSVVSRTAENHILWTYRPTWKLMPDNKDTVYVEFADGKVVKVIKAR